MNLIIFIIYSCLVTYSSLSQVSSVTPDIEHLDKLYHFIIYGIFTILAFGISKSKTFFYMICVGITTYGGLMEICQSLVPNRSMSIYDLISNTTGVILVSLIVVKYFNFKKEKTSNKWI